jgi:2-(1,2-epoxy-1,2-dihydrophenyl)acetyl-CoA isomerase
MREIRYEAADGVATLTIDRPEKRNAMTYAMLAEFEAGVRRASDDPGVRCLLVTGVPGSFCAGIDLADLARRDPGDRGRAGEPEKRTGGLLLVDCPKPVIAAVDGPAVGMGAEFTVQADLRIASTRASFAWNFGRRGLVPDTGAGSWLLPRQIGLTAALRLLFTGETLHAAEARDLGYVLDVVAPDDLPDAARTLAAATATCSPFASSRTKRLVYDGLTGDLGGHLAATRAALAECFASADHAEGVAAFRERRAPDFPGT